MKLWPVIKVGLVIFASVGVLFDDSYTEVGNEIGWMPAIVGLLFFPCIVFVGLFVLKVLFSRTLNFQAPNWGSNPLDFSHPEHFFHLGGLIMLTSGIVGVLSAYIKSGELQPVTVAPLTMGVGMLAGLWVLKMVYTNKQESSNKSKQQGPSGGTH